MAQMAIQAQRVRLARQGRKVYKAMSVGFQPDSGFVMKDDIGYQPMTQPFDSSESENGEGKEAAGTHMRRRKQSQRRRKTSRRTRRH
jgi:hypothetical protein